MKKPVPANSPCSSVPRTLTTALADFSKTSLIPRLMGVVEGSGTEVKRGNAEKLIEGPCAQATLASPKRANENENRDSAERTGRKPNFRVVLEPKSGLITHWRTIENVARRRRGPVSIGA